MKAVKTRRSETSTTSSSSRRCAEFREELFNLRFRNATGELENTARMREARRSLARTLTIASERGIDVEAELRR